MPLLDDELSIWEIGFRWSGFDPSSLRYRFPIALPLEVKDTVRLVLRAIEDGHLYCCSLPATEQIDSLLVDWHQEQWKILETTLEDGIYDRKFLQFHTILRWEFAQWCDKAGIPFPEFWFPTGWITDEPGYPESLRTAVRELSNSAESTIDTVVPGSRIEPNNPAPIVQKTDSQLAKEFAERYAINVWNQPPRTKASVIIRNLLKNKDFRSYKDPPYSEKQIRAWISPFDPKHRKMDLDRLSFSGKTSEKRSDPLALFERSLLKIKK